MKEYLISAQAAVEEIARRDTTDGNVKVFSGQEIISILHSMPQVVPRMRGRWKPFPSDSELYKCSECYAWGSKVYKYCPYCGAAMMDEGIEGVLE